MPDPSETTRKPMPYHEHAFWDGLGTLYATNPRDARYPLSVGYEQLIRRFGGMELEMLAESARADHAEARFIGGRPRVRPDGRLEKDVLDRFASAPDAFCRAGCDVCGETARDNAPFVSRTMVVCPDCGNKRCPRAWNHDNDCTGSNEPGQTPVDANLSAELNPIPTTEQEG